MPVGVELGEQDEGVDERAVAAGDAREMLEGAGHGAALDALGQRLAERGLGAVRLRIGLEGAREQVERLGDRASGIVDAADAQRRELVDGVGELGGVRAGARLGVDAPFEQRLLGAGVAEPAVHAGERAPDGGEALLRLPAPRGEGLGVEVGRGGAGVVVDVVLERAPERHAEIDAPPIVALDRCELGERGDVALDLPCPPRQIEHAREGFGRGRRGGEGGEARVERVAGAVEVVLVERGQLLLDLGGGAAARRGELRFEDTRQEVVTLPGAQRGGEPATLAVALARRLQRGLELLGGAIRLAAETGDLGELEEHLGAAHLVERRRPRRRGAGAPPRAAPGRCARPARAALPRPRASRARGGSRGARGRCEAPRRARRAPGRARPWPARPAPARSARRRAPWGGARRRPRAWRGARPRPYRDRPSPAARRRA